MNILEDRKMGEGKSNQKMDVDPFICFFIQVSVSFTYHDSQSTYKLYIIFSQFIEIPKRQNGKSVCMFFDWEFHGKFKPTRFARSKLFTFPACCEMRI